MQKFSDEAEALSWANGVEYGLASSVWTKDLSMYGFEDYTRIKHVMANIEGY